MLHHKELSFQSDEVDAVVEITVTGNVVLDDDLLLLFVTAEQNDTFEALLYRELPHDIQCNDDHHHAQVDPRLIPVIYFFPGDGIVCIKTGGLALRRLDQRNNLRV